LIDDCEFAIGGVSVVAIGGVSVVTIGGVSVVAIGSGVVAIGGVSVVAIGGVSEVTMGSGVVTIGGGEVAIGDVLASDIIQYDYKNNSVIRYYFYIKCLKFPSNFRKE
jgi:ABC-type uncharacterized transport system permease subunit